MQSDLLFAIHNPRSYPKRSSSDVSVCVETPCYQPTRQKHWGAGGPLLFFSLFSLLCVLCPLIKSVPDISCHQPLSSKSPFCWRSCYLSLSASPCDFQSHSPFNLHYTIHQTHLSEALFSSDSSWPQACMDHPESSCRIIPQLSLCHKVVPILSLRPMQRYLSEPPDLWAVPVPGWVTHSRTESLCSIHAYHPSPLCHPSFLNSYTSFSVHLNESTRSLPWCG